MILFASLKMTCDLINVFVISKQPLNTIAETHHKFIKTVFLLTQNAKNVSISPTTILLTGTTREMHQCAHVHLAIAVILRRGKSDGI